MNIRDIMAKATSAVEFMYDKEAEIQRYEPYKKPSGADGMRWVPKHQNVPCRLSASGLNNTDQGEANAIQYDIKLFLSSRYEIKPGDKVIVKTVKDGEVLHSVEYESAKEPFIYVSHQEVLLNRKDFA
ncbi:hypothetical protein ACFFF5_21050 [Lederbergia wuyishanensis]|uniref:Phage protein n=1 Tax=Lederbergia wuyishanensis TaxID=1347903 RepID=A0ABU0D768_9BACI|nr:hypothetical protein [Lederbergia wuyishanensis]MCJ8008905.1 hypothetical protein [Lederbergia wuyishanensis]MDQ0344230.1 hypothetical protein [Lederbergia wuyishanensis]